MKKGLLVEIFKPVWGSCSNNGLSSKADKCIIIGNGVPEIFSVTDDSPAVQVVERQLNHGPYLTAYPVDKDGKVDTGCMFGGTFIYTSDARFPAKYPIPLHDRKE